MSDAARDPAALEPLELLRVQRSRLADRMRPPRWYLTGIAILWALVFAGPFSQRYLPQGFSIWPLFAVALAVACLLQWGVIRATGIKVGLRNPLSPPGPSREDRGGRGGGGRGAGRSAGDPPGTASRRRDGGGTA